ncbi:MAG TPA: hypothetical protein VIV06_04610 [Candidatus Limnocylindrales bacterium]
MPRARFRFYGQLNDLLAGPRRHVAFDHEFVGRPAVKDTIEAIGVPHPEVELVLVDGEPSALVIAWSMVSGSPSIRGSARSRLTG